MPPVTISATSLPDATKQPTSQYPADAAILLLEDGTQLIGKSIGAKGTAYGELVFNTALTGYQEILTDPSYTGQIVLMTYPEIGNYGVNQEDIESNTGLHAAGFVVRQLSSMASSWRSENELDAYLKAHNIVGISGIDTRALTRKIRAIGAPKTAITTEFNTLPTVIKNIQQLPDFAEQDFVFKVSTQAPYTIETGNLDAKTAHLAILDFGIKQSIIEQLKPYAKKLTLLPANTSFETIMALAPDAVFLSNGPGDPNALTGVVALIQQLLAVEMPLIGICLGHQLLALACGAKVIKMSFGHHGGNHPVKDIEADRIMITSQNHSYAVEMASFPEDNLAVTFINLNDKTIEGLKHRSKKAYSVQFHPEAGPGPHDARNWFAQVFKLL